MFVMIVIDGRNVSLVEGICVGKIDGINVGKWVGFMKRISVGIVEGMMVGKIEENCIEVGIWEVDILLKVGISVGIVDGLRVIIFGFLASEVETSSGICVGILEGIDVGILDGIIVGQNFIFVVGK